MPCAAAGAGLVFSSLAFAFPPPVLRRNASRHGWLAGLSLWPLLAPGLPSQSNAQLPDATVQDSVLYYSCSALRDWLRALCGAWVYSPGVDMAVSVARIRALQAAGCFQGPLPSSDKV